MSERDPDSGAIIPEDATAPFPNPCETAMDIDAQAQSRVLTQYRESTKMRARISADSELWQGIEDCMVDIPKQRDPAIAEGVNLDVTGSLVGQSRVLSDGTESSDAFYRTLIAARIARNNSIGSAPEYIKALEDLVFVGSPFRFYDLGHMSVGIEVPGEPNSNQKALINDGPMPRAMAVGVSKVWYTDGDYFGFDEDTDPGAKGFGLESDPDVGGRLAMNF